jgi:hypothetical protein
MSRPSAPSRPSWPAARSAPEARLAPGSRGPPGTGDCGTTEPDISIGHELPDHFGSQAAIVYDEAFGDKLRMAIPGTTTRHPGEDPTTVGALRRLPQSAPREPLGHLT